MGRSEEQRREGVECVECVDIWIVVLSILEGGKHRIGRREVGSGATRRGKVNRVGWKCMEALEMCVRTLQVLCGEMVCEGRIREVEVGVEQLSLGPFQLPHA